MPDSIAQLTTTTPSEDVADAIAIALVDDRLAACVQVSGPVRSRYRWHGAIETATEWQVVVKTIPERVPVTMARIVELHPYDVPEVLVHVLDATSGYAEWLRQEVR